MPLTWPEIAKLEPIRLNLGGGVLCHPDPLFPHYISVDWEAQTDWSVSHDLSKPVPLADGSVERIVSEHFLEHMTAAHITGVFRECHRLLQPGGIARFAVPDYEHPRERYCLALGHDPRRRDHLSLPTRAWLEELIAGTPFGTGRFYHYWRDGRFHEQPIDHSLGYIRRTPENDPRNRCSGARQYIGRFFRDVGEIARHGFATKRVHLETRRFRRLAITSIVFDLRK